MSVNVDYWEKVFDDIPFSKVSIKMIHGFPFIVYDFGKFPRSVQGVYCEV